MQWRNKWIFSYSRRIHFIYIYFIAIDRPLYNLDRSRVNESTSPPQLNLCCLTVSMTMKFGVRTELNKCHKEWSTLWRRIIMRLETNNSMESIRPISSEIFSFCFTLKFSIKNLIKCIKIKMQCTYRGV